MKRLLFVCNDAWFFVSHRLPIARAAVAAGYEVHVMATHDDSVELIKEAGCHWHSWLISPRGSSLTSEFQALLQLHRVIREVKPDVIHLITIKPVLYGGLLARLNAVPAVVYAVSGVGTMFAGSGGLSSGIRTLVKYVYRSSINHKNSSIIFQNSEDRDLLVDTVGVNPERTMLIRGSGVDLTEYSFQPESSDEIVVFMAARLLRDKGVLEYIEAARQVLERGCNAKFLLAGDFVAEGNPASLTAQERADLNNQKSVQLLGQRDDIAALVENANIVVLPSYREGLPRFLIEAAAVGRAVVTTDVPGCRHAIVNNETGLLVPPRDANELANAIEYLIVNHDTRIAMGNAGRRLAEKEFDIINVVDKHLAIYQSLLKA